MTLNWVDAMNEPDPNKKEALLLEAEKTNKHNPIDLHFTYNIMIDYYYSLRNESTSAIDSCIKYCKKDIELFPQFKKSSIKEGIERLRELQKLSSGLNDKKRIREYEDEIKHFQWVCPRIPSFQRLAIIYDKQSRFGEAIEVCELAIKYDLDDGTKGSFEGRIERLYKKMNNPPNLRKKPSRETIEQNELMMKNSIDVVNTKDDIDGFMLTFSKSTSPNFERALFLARKADKFQVSDYNEQKIYQASFLPENHLNFITLYELVGKWKSTFVFKDGEMIDRKVLGQINYCYGDKLRSNSESFCYGASMFTENPFGCHRLMIHSGQKPWYKWVKSEDSKYIYIDKSGIHDQIEEKAATFKLCPSFNYEKVMHVFNEIPERLNKKSELYKKLYNDSYSKTFSVDVGIHYEKEPPKRKTSEKGFLAKLLRLFK